MFNEGLSLHKFAYMALPESGSECKESTEANAKKLIDVIDNDAIVLQSTEANAKKVEECLAATIKIGVSCSLDSPPQRMKIEIIVIELQRLIQSLHREVESNGDKEHRREAFYVRKLSLWYLLSNDYISIPEKREFLNQRISVP
ncbi:hypothetical protein Tco_1495968, partial [Tanacetum coccineum]